MTDGIPADDFDVTTSESAPSGAVPLSEIFSEAASPDVRQSSSIEMEPRSRDDSAWLERETSRRAKADERAEKLRAQLEKFENAKWGLTEEPAEQPDQYRDSQQEQQSEQQPAYQREYDAGYTDFAKTHGKGRVDAVDQVIARLNPGQKQALLDEIGRSGVAPKDAAAKAVEILEGAGLLDPAFKQQSIADVLAGKKQDAPADTSQADQRLADMGRRVEAAERNTAFVASRSEFVSEHGKAAYNDLDAVCKEFTASGHPGVAEFAQSVRTHPDPVGAAAYLLSQWGIWSPAQQQQPQQQRQADRPIFPSNVAGARNVGARRGPAWSGPSTLNDIFSRRRPEN